MAEWIFSKPEDVQVKRVEDCGRDGIWPVLIVAVPGHPELEVRYGAFAVPPPERLNRED